MWKYLALAGLAAGGYVYLTNRRKAGVTGAGAGVKGEESVRGVIEQACGPGTSPLDCLKGLGQRFGSGGATSPAQTGGTVQNDDRVNVAPTGEVGSGWHHLGIRLGDTEYSVSFPSFGGLDE